MCAKITCRIASYVILPTLSVLPETPTNEPLSSATAFLLISVSPHPEQSKRSITFTLPSANVCTIKEKLSYFYSSFDK